MMNNPWRRLGEAIASLPAEYQKEFLQIVMDLPVQPRGSVLTAYIISKINNVVKTRDEIIELLNLAKDAGLITTTRTPAGIQLYYRTKDNIVFLPINDNDKRAIAILLTARRKSSELNTKDNLPKETVKPRLKNI